MLSFASLIITLATLLIAFSLGRKSGYDKYTAEYGRTDDTPTLHDREMECNDLAAKLHEAESA